MRFHEKLQKYFELDRKRSQTDVAADAGISQSRLSKLKNPDNPRKVYSHELAPLAEAMGLPLAYLVDDRINNVSECVEQLTQDERMVVQLMRSLDLDANEAIKRLAVPAPVATAPTPAKVVRTVSKSTEPPSGNQSNGKNVTRTRVK